MAKVRIGANRIKEEETRNSNERKSVKRKRTVPIFINQQNKEEILS